MTETYAKICRTCDNSFLGESEILNLCPKCMRKYDLDVAFEEIFFSRKKEFLESFKKDSDELWAKRDQELTKTIKKFLKSSKWIRYYNLAYLTLGMIFWILSWI